MGEGGAEEVGKVEELGEGGGRKRWKRGGEVGKEEEKGEGGGRKR